MPNKKPIIIIAVLSVMALGLGYWYGLPEEGSGRGKEAAEKASAEKAAADKAAAKAAPNGINQTSDVKIGTPIWEFETGKGVRSSPAIGSDGTVYVGSIDKKLYAIKTDSKGLAKSPWPMRGQNARHTGRSPAK